MTELLVVVACLYGKGCSETSSTYYDSKPELQLFVKRTERRITATVGQATVTYVAPPLIFALGGSGIIKLNQHVNLQVNKNLFELKFNKDF